MKKKLSSFEKFCFDVRVQLMGGPHAYLGNCRVCRSKVSINADACPQCGEPDPCRGFIANYTMGCFLKLILIGIIGTGIILFLIFGFPSSYEETASSSKEVVKEEPTSHYRVYLRNECEEKVTLAICYFNQEKEWVVEGWWHLEPSEGTFVSIKPSSKNLYLFAETPTGLVWDGEGKKGSVRLPVDRENAFAIISGKEDRSRRYDAEEFFVVNMGERPSVYRHAFSCD